MCFASPPAPPPPAPLPPPPAAPEPPSPPPAPPTPVTAPGSAGERIATIRSAASTRTRARQAASGTAQLRMPQTTVTPAPQGTTGATTGLNIPK